MGRPAYGDGCFRRLSASISDAEWVVKLYYAASIYLTARLMLSVDATVQAATAWDFLWPLQWLNGTNPNLILRWLSVACFVSSLVAFQFHRCRAARGLFSILFLLAATVPNSLGGINHPYHSWFFVGAIFILLPDGLPAAMDRAGKLSYLTVIRAAEALFLLFYTMTGTWKFVFGCIAIATGHVGNFSPDALSETLANRVLQTGTNPLLADFVINNVWLAWPGFLAVIYVQMASIAVAFRPRLHVAWGYLQIAFHLGTWLLMQIIFNEHVLLLIILLVLSPQRTAFSVEALRDLPLLGWAFRRRPRPEQAEPVPVPLQ